MVRSDLKTVRRFIMACILLQTANKKGFDFGVPSYRIESWIECYDDQRQQPLLDLGCGYGK